MTIEKSWLFVIVIGSSIVFLGGALDFFLKKSELSFISKKCFILSQKVKNIDIVGLQISIAQYLIYFLRTFSTSLALLISSIKSEVVLLLASLFIFVLVAGIIVYLNISGNLWVLYVIGPYAIFGILFLIIIVFIESLLFKWSYKIDNICLVIFQTTLASTILTSIAIFISNEFIPSNLLNTSWFYQTKTDTIIPNNPVIIGLINYPFDFISLVITYKLMMKFIKIRRFIILFALIDILSALLLTFLLYYVFSTIENGINFIENVSDLFFLFLPLERISTNSLNNVEDLHLLPILLTTCVPILLYMSILIILSYYKYVSNFLSRTLHVISEKEDSIFKQISILLVLGIATVKAFIDYFYN